MNQKLKLGLYSLITALFLIGLLSFTNKEYPGLSYGGQEIITFPARPKAIFVEMYMLERSAIRDMKLYYSKGYTLKTLTSNDNFLILVMEKY